MKIYKVKVNGKLYEVELESVSENERKIEAPVASETPTAQTNGKGESILAPIAGKLLEIRVKVGDKVTVGQNVAIIEAMKLENEVPSPFAGTVKEIVVQTGSQVNNKDVLIILG